MKKRNKKRKLEFKTAELVTILIAISVVSMLTGCLLGHKYIPDGLIEKESSEISSELQEFIDEYNEIKETYYGEFNEQELLSNAFKAIVESLGDSYSGEFDTESSSVDAVKLEGVYEGVGIEIYSNVIGKLIINSVFKDSPADKAGIKPGDIISKINGASVDGYSSTDVATQIKGFGKNVFTFELIRNNTKINVSIKSEKIVLKSVITNIHTINNKNIGYIGVGIFANNTAEQFKEALKELENSKVDGLILDFRGNPGGYLHTATKMADMLLDSTNIVYKTKSETVVEGFYSNGNKDYDKKIVILINGGSASASELITATLKENLGATVVGEKSFGKGTVQELRQFGGLYYKYTTKLWLTPNGKSINGVGITPDIEVKFDVTSDTQLQKALEQFK